MGNSVSLRGLSGGLQPLALGYRKRGLERSDVVCMRDAEPAIVLPWGEFPTCKRSLVFGVRGVI